jgi:hypothetical protein
MGERFLSGNAFGGIGRSDKKTDPPAFTERKEDAFFTTSVLRGGPWNAFHCCFEWVVLPATPHRHLILGDRRLALSVLDEDTRNRRFLGGKFGT